MKRTRLQSLGFHAPEQTGDGVCVLGEDEYATVFTEPITRYFKSFVFARRARGYDSLIQDRCDGLIQDHL
ncbi:hypothetical protein, partial [Mycobacterium kiyosense]|uniref:hypothetical protein n=1 Tax=Mycobacterium kiyosense TaxID=2871094 RepID=UPI00222E20B6